MPRARNLKPNLFKNEDLGTIDPIVTLLFQGLWCLADREGRLEDRPLRINAEIFPYRGFTAEQINGYLTVLASLEFIHRYEVGNLKLIQVLKFTKHQSPHKTEKASELPPEANVYKGQTQITVKAPLDTEEVTDEAALTPSSLIPSSLIPEAAKTPPEARGGEGRGIASIPVNPEVDESIDAFLSKVRRIYDVNVLPNEQRWLTTVIQADEAGITPDQFAFALSTLLSDKSRRFPVTPQNALDAALNERAKKAKPLADGKPIFTH